MEIVKCFDLAINKTLGDAGYRSLCFSHAKRALFHLSYTPSILIENKTYKLFSNDLFRANLSPSPAGNWTPVSRVTGGDTDHYTTEDEYGRILYDKVSDLFFVQALK
jgi:hypothetical protein